MTGRKKNHTKSLLNSVSFFHLKMEKKKKAPKLKIIGQNQNLTVNMLQVF